MVVDKVVVAAGLKPNTDLALSGRLEVDPARDGFVVNSELLARSDIWVVCIYVDDIRCNVNVVLCMRKCSLRGGRCVCVLRHLSRPPP